MSELYKKKWDVLQLIVPSEYINSQNIIPKNKSIFGQSSEKLFYINAVELGSIINNEKFTNLKLEIKNRDVHIIELHYFDINVLSGFLVTLPEFYLWYEKDCEQYPIDVINYKTKSINKLLNDLEARIGNQHNRNRIAIMCTR